MCSGFTMHGAANTGDLRAVGRELHVSVQIDDFEAEDIADLLCPNKECHALRGGLFSIRDLFEVRDIFGHVSCPALYGRVCIPVQQIIDGSFENFPDAKNEKDY